MPLHYSSRVVCRQSVMIFQMKSLKKPVPGVRHIEVDENHSGQRLDNFLVKTLKGVPKTHIYRILRKGEVRINKGRTQPDYRLKVGDVVRIPPVRTSSALAKSGGSQVKPETRFAWLAERVLYEDEVLLAIDKPASLAVHGGSGVSLGLIEALRQLRPQTRFLELVHRLDRETSGCLLVAKKRAALLGLHELLRDGGVDKRYWALVQGVWRGKARRIEAGLEKNRLRSGERMVNISATGKKAVSFFTPKRVYANASLVEIKLLTGRTHQARVHAAYLDHPIAGDEKYGERNFNREMRSLGLQRLFLHAASLRFNHPTNGSKLYIQAPLPAELNNFLEQLTDEKKLLS